MSNTAVELITATESNWRSLHQLVKTWNNKGKASKKKIIAELLASNNLLTSSVVDQSKAISSLTAENARYEMQTKFLEKELENQKNENASSADKLQQLEKQCLGMKRDHDRSQNELRVRTYQSRDLTTQKDKLTTQIGQLRQTISDLQHQIGGLQAKYDALEKEHGHDSEVNTSLKAEVDLAKHKLLMAAFTIKLLSDQNQRHQEMIQQKNREISHLQDEKLQLVNYFNSQYGPRRPGNEGQITTIATVGTLNWSIDDLQTKLLDADCRLYRRACLVQELCFIIRQHEPSFRLHDNPLLRFYADDIDTSYESDL